VAAEQPLGIPGRLAALAARLGLPEFTNQEAQLGVQWDELGRGERAGELLELGELTDHPDTVATTWALSLARAQAEAPAAQAPLALGLADYGMRLQVPPLVGLVVEPLVPLKSLRSPPP
jgi:hypothetical protein